MRGLEPPFFCSLESARPRLSHLSKPTRNAGTRVLWSPIPKRTAEPGEHPRYHRSPIEHRRMKYRVARNCAAKFRQLPSGSRDGRVENGHDPLCAYPSPSTAFYAALATLGFRNNVEFLTLHAHKRRLCRHSFGCDPVRQIPSSALALDPASFKQPFRDRWRFRKLDSLDPATIS